MRQGLAIVGLCVAAAVVYGLVHDQVTVRLSLEYFTVLHPHVVDTDSPTVLALVWGVIASWWMGAGAAVAGTVGWWLAAGGRVPANYPDVPPERQIATVAVAFAHIAAESIGVAGGLFLWLWAVVRRMRLDAAAAGKR